MADADFIATVDKSIWHNYSKGDTIIEMESPVLPNFLQPYLWSYDLNQLDLADDREVIITNILDLGNEAAVKWLFSAYPKELIVKTVANAKSGFWHDKSLNFWSLVFGLQYYPELTRGHSARFLSLNALRNS